MELPANKEYDEKVVRVPEPLKFSTTSLLESKEDHGEQDGGHNPPCNSRSSGEVGCQKCNNTLSSGSCISVGHSQLVEVDHVSGYVNDCASND